MSPPAPSPTTPGLAGAGAAAWLAGAAVMLAELGLGRIAAPWLGSSQPVWATVIAGVLLGGALGNALGGARLRGEPRRTAAALLFAAGLAVALLPRSLALVLESAGTGAGAFAGLAALGLAAAIPALPLGALSPVLVRATTRTLEEVGPTSGRLSALSTLGALCGTLGGAFVLTPWLGSSRTFALTGAALFLAAVVLARVPAVGPGVLVLALLPAIEAGPPPGERRLARRESSSGTWQVTEDAQGVRWLRTDEGATAQSFFDPAEDLTSGSWALLAAAPLLAGRGPEDPSRTALLGVAGGTVAREILRAFPRATVLGFEPDPVPVELGRAFLDLPRERLEVRTGDGRAGLAAADGPFEAIVVDAFRSVYVPFHLVTRELFELGRARLAPGGVVLVNLLSAKRWRQGRGTGEGPLVDAVAATARRTFAHVACLDVGNGLNTILVAGDRPLDGEALAVAAAQVAARRPALARRLARALPTLASAPRGGLVLTDDDAPVEWLAHRLALERLGALESSARPEDSR